MKNLFMYKKLILFFPFLSGLNKLTIKIFEMSEQIKYTENNSTSIKPAENTLIAKEEDLMERKLINVDNIEILPTDYPDEFKQFCTDNMLKPPSFKTGNGKALSAMLEYKDFYWNREMCDKFVEKFNIQTKDSIQLFNKHSQWGILTSNERGKSYIIYPYKLSNKHKMRKNFKFDGTEEEKNSEIEKIKSTIKTDYCDVPNELWQLGHKNPGSTNNTNTNLVLQPPIQAKYRDNYVFIDTLTKFPLAPKLKTLIEKNEIELTIEQIKEYKDLFEQLLVTKKD